MEELGGKGGDGPLTARQLVAILIIVGTIVVMALLVLHQIQTANRASAQLNCTISQAAGETCR